MQPTTRIFVAGHRGLVGSALVRRLQAAGYTRLILRTSQELDLRNQAATQAFFAAERPEVVLLAAAKVGGIYANHAYPATFITDNLQIQSNVIEAAYRSGVQRLLFLGSSCIYPRESPQPITEEQLLGGPLEATNEPYAIAKIAGLKMCHAYNRQYGTNYLCVMPSNLYGPEDNYDLESAHVLPALIRKMHEAKVQHASQVVVWGSGTPRREFLYSDDLADACIHLLKTYDSTGRETLINVGAGKDISIRQLAELVASVVGFEGALKWDTSKPDGTPQKLLDIQRITELGWQPATSLPEGIARAYRAFVAGAASCLVH
ncbi:MAG TPA: GDP-L-fucose synthase [Stenomitos sp.]